MIRRLLRDPIALLLFAAFIFTMMVITAGVVFTSADAASPSRWRACPTEDSGRHCVWDARHRGNGLGHSFIRKWDGETTVWISHKRAHRLLSQR